MALTRKFLSALGIEAEKQDEIIQAHTEAVDALKNERDRYRTDAEKLPDVQAELDAAKQAAEAQDGKSPWKVKYEALEEEFETYKADQAEKESKAAKSEAFRALLREAGIPEKRLEAVLRVSDVDAVELDKDGQPKGKDKLLEGIKTEWADFIPTITVHGANTPNPPANNGGTRKTKEEIYAIKDPGERQRAILENHELFGI